MRAGAPEPSRRANELERNEAGIQRDDPSIERSSVVKRPGTHRRRKAKTVSTIRKRPSMLDPGKIKRIAILTGGGDC
jgi:hypothetical protein